MEEELITIRKISVPRRCVWTTVLCAMWSQTFSMEGFMTRSFFLIAASALLLSQVGSAMALPVDAREKCRKKGIPLKNCVCYQDPARGPVCSDNRKKIDKKIQ